MSNAPEHGMQPEPLEAAAAHPQRAVYPPITAETRTHVDTAQAAYYLNRAQQTLRIWACREQGALRPIRVNGRLAWPVAGIRAALGV